MRAVQDHSVILCPYVYTCGSDTILIRIICEKLKDELLSFVDSSNLDSYIYQHLDKSIPMQVSDKFYSYVEDFIIKPSPLLR